MALKMLDLFCGAGGASMGYHRAGFEMTGVDLHPMPRYPFTFIQGDALEYLAKHGHEYDAIAASPPCQRFTVTQNARGNADKHPDLVAPTRELLIATGKPYVIENVVGAPLKAPLLLCGSMFGLKVYRHRLFESNVVLFAPSRHYPHRDQTPRAGRGISPKGFISAVGNCGNMPYVSMAMGIDWMNLKEIVQSIPPAFTEHIGKQLKGYLNECS